MKRQESRNRREVGLRGQSDQLPNKSYDEGYLDNDARYRHNSTVTVLNYSQGLASWQSSRVVEVVLVDLAVILY